MVQYFFKTLCFGEASHGENSNMEPLQNWTKHGEDLVPFLQVEFFKLLYIHKFVHIGCSLQFRTKVSNTVKIV